jgi:hypothetical protein
MPGVDFNIDQDTKEPSRQSDPLKPLPLFDNDKDMKAHENGYLVVFAEEFYCKQISFGSEVFIQKKRDAWGTWRETWGMDRKQSKSIKVIANNVPFEVALRKANDYINSFRGWKGNPKKK